MHDKKVVIMIVGDDSFFFPSKGKKGCKEKKCNKKGKRKENKKRTPKDRQSQTHKRIHREQGQDLRSRDAELRIRSNAREEDTEAAGTIWRGRPTGTAGGRSNGVLARPLTSGGFVPGTVGLVDVGDLGHQRIIRVGVCEHRADGQQH